MTPDQPFIRDHRVGGVPMAPGVLMLEMARAETRASCLRDITWVRPLIVEGPVEVRVRVNGDRFEVVTGQDVVHAVGRISSAGDPPPPVDVKQILDRLTEVWLAGECYGAFRKRGIEYGPAFQGLQELRSGPDEAFATIAAPEGIGGTLTLHPTILDSALQSVAALIGFEASAGAPLPLPFGLGALQIYSAAQIPLAAYAHARRTSAKGGIESFRILVLDRQGNVCAAFEDFSVKCAAEQRPDRESEGEVRLLRPVWRETAVEISSFNAGGSTLIVTEAEGRGVANKSGSFQADWCWKGSAARDPSASEHVYFLGGLSTSPFDPFDLDAVESGGSIALMRFAQALERRGLLQRPLTLKVVTNRSTPIGADAIGFAMALGKEYARLRVCLIEVELENGALADADLRALIAESGRRVPGFAAWRTAVRA